MGFFIILLNAPLHAYLLNNKNLLSQAYQENTPEFACRQDVEI